MSAELVLHRVIERAARVRPNDEAFSSVSYGRRERSVWTWGDLHAELERARDVVREVSAGETIAVPAAAGGVTPALIAALIERGASVQLLDPQAPRGEHARVAAASGSRLLGAITPSGSTPGRPPSLVLSTSGVSGDPKLVRRAWDDVATNCAAFAAVLSLEPRSVVLGTSVLSSSYGMCAGVLTALSAEASFVCLADAPTVLPEVLASIGVDVVLSTPRLYELAEAPMKPLFPSRLALTAGERRRPDVGVPVVGCVRHPVGAALWNDGARDAHPRCARRLALRRTRPPRRYHRGQAAAGRRDLCIRCADGRSGLSRPRRPRRAPRQARVHDQRWWAHRRACRSRGRATGTR